ncbi:MAG: response regulator [Alphaproteobacteria bacterium]|nr:response regulator [Alphaproteobacteria bacterium]
MNNILKKIKLPRPDKLLQRKLILLAYSLFFLTVSLIAFIVYPQNVLLFLSTIAFLTLVCLILSLQTLKAAEEALNYGGFANAVISQSSNAKRIESFKGKIILENDGAKELFGGQNILWFLQNHLAEIQNNNLAFQQLKNAFINLSNIRVVIALNLAEKNQKQQNFSWFQVSLKTIDLRKKDFFESPFAIKKVQKNSYLYWSFRDITAEHNMELIFQNERLSMHNFLDYMPTALYIVDKEYNIEYCNYIMAEKLGKKREEVIGNKITDFLAENSLVPPSNVAWSGFIHMLNNKGEAFECCIKQDSFRDGNEIKTRAAAIVDLPNDDVLKSNLQDVKDKNSWLFDFAPIGIVFTDVNGNVVNYNQQAMLLMKKNNENCLGHVFTDFVDKNNHHTLIREMQSVAENEKKSTNLQVAFKESEKNVIAYITPMKKLYSGNQEKPSGLIFYLIDASEQKNLEIQFAQAQKMQAVGQLAGGIAHDFNNLLTAIIGFCDLLLLRHGVGDPSFADLMQVKNNANRAAGLVRQLLAYSRKQPMQPKYIDVTENFIELSQMLKRVLGERIILKFHHGENLGFTRVDPVQFSQVIINLAVNAKDAMNGNGVLTIVTRTEEIKTPRQFGDAIIKPGDFIVIDVQDTGCGIAKEHLTRIFEPFFSTKENVVGSGTGLGLSVVSGIVQQTGGFINVDSVLGQGTTFSIYLPRFENNPDLDKQEEDNKPRNLTADRNSPITNVKRQKNAPVTPINQKLIFGLNVSAIDKGIDGKRANKDIKILFVEDEDSVRNFAVRALQKKGYNVIACNSAENALEQLKNIQDINLLITDMVMPGMNGIELGKIVKEKIPDIKIILASGYSEEIARNEHAVSSDFEFLSKPFSLADLTQKIFDVLSRE